MFHFILQCISVHFFESGLCRLDKSWTAENLHLNSQEAGFFIKVIIMHQTFGFIGLFSLHIEPPHMNQFMAIGTHRILSSHKDTHKIRTNGMMTRANIMTFSATCMFKESHRICGNRKRFY